MGKGREAATGKDRAEIRLGQGQGSMQGKDSQRGKTEHTLGKLIKSAFISLTYQENLINHH